MRFRTQEVSALYEEMKPWCDPDQPFVDVRYAARPPITDFTPKVAEWLLGDRIEAINELWGILFGDGLSQKELLRKALLAEVDLGLGFDRQTAAEIKAINMLGYGTSLYQCGHRTFFVPSQLRASRPADALIWTEDEFWINRVINLNFSLRCQQARWLRGQGVRAFPARRLDFLKGCNVEAWKRKWDEARAITTTEGSTDSTLCIALFHHPIWSELSEFGLPYPPFDWDFDGCGSVDLRLVGFTEARDLGILPGKASSPQHRAMMCPLSGE